MENDKLITYVYLPKFSLQESKMGDISRKQHSPVLNTALQ